MDVDGASEQGGRTPLVGRQEELDRIQSLLDDDRPLITITGPPGIGKTRVARRMAAWAESDGRFGTHGVVFCDLSEAWTVADVVDAVAGVLDAHLSSGEGGESSVALLGRAIEGRGPLLVVLDNFEQLVDHAADTISRWIDMAPLARFLVTSRDRLRLRGESSVELPPLVSEQAVDLFIATAQRVRESFTASPDDRSVLESLVQRLDGIPLAIELAAARVTVMSPQRMLDRIDKRFQLLKHGPSDGTPRQATLRAAIDWSWELLTEAERTALSQCSVFRGGFTLEDAEAVVLLDGDDDVLDLLEALCRKSLVRSIEPDGGSGEIRFGIYESIRAYALEHLDADGDGVFVRHADHFLDHAEAQILEFGSPEGTDLAWVEHNRDNIVAICSRFKDTDPGRAVRAALCVAHTNLRRGPYDSLLSLMESVTPVDDEDATITIRYRLARGSTKSIMGRHDSAHDDLQFALEQAEGTDLEGTVRLHLGLHYLRGGEFDPATKQLSAAMALCEADGRGRIHARSLVSMGMAHEAVARFTEAEECYVKAASIARRLGDRWEMARTRSKMGSLCSFVAGRQDEARSHFAWALDEARAVGDAFIAAGTGFNLGRLELNAGQHADAEAHLCEALVAYRDMANRVSEGFVRMALGLLHLDRGAADTAHQELALAEEMLSEVRHALAGAFTQMTLALALLEEGDAASAQHEAEAALGTVVAAKHQVLEGIACCVCCVVSMVQGDPDACTKHRDRAQECLGETGWGEGNSMLAMAEACVERVAGGQPAVPSLASVPHARARVGWRLIAGDTAPQESVAPAVPDVAPTGSDALPPDGLVVHREGRWFCSPGSVPVDLTRKRTLRPMLLVLARQREDSPGDAIDVETLFEEVWKGERVLPAAKKNRIYVAIATLRKSGLDALTTRGDGYLLSPDMPLHWAD